MYQYSNAYSCAMDQAGETVILQFRQNGPIFGEDGRPNGTEAIPVASIVMGTDMAKALGDALSALVSETEDASLDDNS